MRIIAGRWKGHPLITFQASHIRPTTDRVKETQFNILQFSIPESHIVDLFCGTGNLGLESLSRGAAHVLFVDKHPKSLSITKSNLEKLKADLSEYSILSSDVIQFLKKYQGDPFDVIFADPPFTEEMAHEVMLAADQSLAFGPSTVMSIESAKRERIDVDYGTIARFNVREFGDKVLSFYKKKEGV